MELVTAAGTAMTELLCTKQTLSEVSTASSREALPCHNKPSRLHCGYILRQMNMPVCCSKVRHVHCHAIAFVLSGNMACNDKAAYLALTSIVFACVLLSCRCSGTMQPW